MVQFFGVLLLIVSLTLLVLATTLFVECFLSLLPPRKGRSLPTSSRPSIAILIPAHNEAAGIGQTLQSLLAQLAPQDRLVVIADNCTDETATIARNCGVTVIERQDNQRRGKGYALDFGLKWLQASPPEVVVMVDADCLVAGGAIEAIAQQAAAQSRPVQATYLMSSEGNKNPKKAVSSLAFMVKNLVRPSGLDYLGLPCLLTGTGMAFPWTVLQKVSLASGNIVEDMKLSLDLAVAGYPPSFCPDAKVIGCLPEQSQAARSQRTRWEHGHLQTLVGQVPRLLGEGLRQGRFDLLAIALDLAIPPLSLFVVLWIGITLAALAYSLLGGTLLPLAVLVLVGAQLFSAILIAWVGYGRKEIPVSALLAVPLYIFWKIPLYFAFLVKPETKWVRTDRDVIDSSKVRKNFF
jgi:cellulose synthase/poly-beta-1,6-N-acetylglucosamine synthase-like glycosyltransferase